MPRPPKLHRDINETAFAIVRAATGEGPKPVPSGEQANPEAARRGRKGGKKGGKRRAAKLSATRRKAIAKRAAQARWQPEPR